MFLEGHYGCEEVRRGERGRQVEGGGYILRGERREAIPRVSTAVDEQFVNSRAPTKTESEKAFQQSFVAMSSAIITSLQVISVVIVGIILLVLANTILMAVRERTREYAVLKTLGFSARHLFVLIFGESLLIAICGGLIGLALTFPMVAGFGKALPTFFPIINVAPLTIVLALGAALIAGAVAALFPTTRVVRTPIVTGLRTGG